MKWSTRLATIAGIDIKIHATFVLVLAFGAYTWGSRAGLDGALFGLLLTILLFASVVLHELGHSLVAKAVGIPVKEIVLLPIGGVAIMGGRVRKAWHELVIALAGPAVNVVIAVALFAVAVTGVWTGTLPTSTFDMERILQPGVSSLLAWLLAANVSLAVFNMFPAFPMDGGRVLRAVLSMTIGYERASRFSTRLGQVLAVGLGGYGLLSGNPMLAIIGVFVFLGASQERASDAARAALAGIRAGDVTERPALSLSAHHRVGDVARAMIGAPQRHYPVFNGPRLVGVLSRETAVAVVGAGGAAIAVEDVMDPNVPTVHVNDSVEQVLEMMSAKEARVAVAVDDRGWVGLVSHAHAMQAAELLRALRDGSSRPAPATPPPVPTSFRESQAR